MTIKSKSALETQIATDVADNNERNINALKVRTVLDDILDSVHGVYGALYVAGGSSAQDVADTLELLTGWAADGLSNGTTSAHASDTITVGTAGVYAVWCQLQGVGEATTDYLFAVTKNTTPETNIRAGYTSTGTETFTVALTGLLSCAASDTISIYVMTDNSGGADYTLVNGQLVVYRVA